MSRMEITKEDKKILNQVFWRNGFLNMSGNKVDGNARGFTFSLIPAILEYYKGDEENIKEAMVRHMQFFNTHAVPATFIAGIATGMEKEKAATGKIDGDVITKVKTSLMGPLAGIGDAFFYTALRAIVAGIAIGFANQGSVMAPLVFILLYGVTQLLCKFYLVRLGFTAGASLIEKAFSSGIIPIVTKVAGIIGLTMIGAMVASNVSVNVVAAPLVNGVEVSIQGFFDGIAPGVLKIALWYLVFRLLRNGKSPMLIIFGLLFAGILLSLFGIL